MTSRQGEEGAYGFNLGDHVGDNLADVDRRRQEMADRLGSPVLWLQQVHGHRVVRLQRTHEASAPGWLVDGVPWSGQTVQADGSFTTDPGVMCAVMVADCLPVLLAAPEGGGVAALHAGWRGLLGDGPHMQGQGVVDVGVRQLCEAAGCLPAELQAWLGPCIGPTAFEVGEDVLASAMRFGASQAHFKPVTVPMGASEGKWLADLPGLAREKLLQLGVRAITGGQWCTYSDPGRFFSFRRERVTGRQAALIGLRAR